MKKILSKILSIFFLFLILVFLYLLLLERNPSEIPSNLLNKKIPNFETETLFNNKKFKSTEEFGKEIVLVNFFATWCKPCRDEHSFIKLFADEKGIKVIGINYKDNTKKTLAWLKEFDNPYSNIPLDKKGRIAIDWGVYGIPETFLVNSKGVIKYRNAGPINKKTYRKINLLIRDIKNE